MSFSRREFLFLSACFTAGCSSVQSGQIADTMKNGWIDAGPLTDYGPDGVYSKFAERGFFIVRNGALVFALSAICTHRKCKLIAEPDRSFYCKCHGSTFDSGGHVTEGPARRDLPVFQTVTDDNRHLLVKIPS